MTYQAEPEYHANLVQTQETEAIATTGQIVEMVGIHPVAPPMIYLDIALPPRIMSDPPSEQ